MTNHIVCFDTETTGLDVQRDSIIQLSLVKFNSRTFEEIEALDWYILPSCPYLYYIRKKLYLCGRKGYILC